MIDCQNLLVLIIVSIMHSPETLLGVALKTCDPLWFTSCTECLAQPLTPSLFKPRSWSTVLTSGLRGKRGCPSETRGMTGGSCDLRQWGGNNHNVTFSWIIKYCVPILVRLKMLHFHLSLRQPDSVFFDSCITADKWDSVSWSSSETSVQSSSSTAAAL